MEADGPALIVDGEEFTHAQLVDRARRDAAKRGLTAGSRMLSGLGYDTWDGLSAGLFAALAADASVVLCRNLDRLDPQALTARTETERVTHTAA